MKNNIEQQLQQLGAKIQPNVSELTAAKEKMLEGIKNIPPGGLPAPQGSLWSLFTTQNILISLGALAAIIGTVLYIALSASEANGPTDTPPPEQQEVIPATTEGSIDTEIEEDGVDSDGAEEQVPTNDNGTLSTEGAEIPRIGETPPRVITVSKDAGFR